MQKNIVVNFDANGKFISATKQPNDLIDEEGNIIPQMNETISLEEVINIVKEA